MLQKCNSYINHDCIVKILSVYIHTGSVLILINHPRRLSQISGTLSPYNTPHQIGNLATRQVRTAPQDHLASHVCVPLRVSSVAEFCV